MFEAAELGRKISKEDFIAQLPELRTQLLQAQFALSQTNSSVIILISGVDAAGRGEVVSVLNEWLDARGLETFSFDRHSEETNERPFYWKYWRCLPARGRIGIFFGAWYVDPIREMAYQNISTSVMDEGLNRIRRFETMLVEDDTVIIKFWLHLSHKKQIKRLKAMEKDPNALRCVSERDWKHAHLYQEFQQAAERAIRYTDSGVSPWFLVEASDKRYRDLTVGRTVLNAINQCLTRQEQAKTLQSNSDSNTTFNISHNGFEKSPKATLTVLDHMDLTQRLTTEEYKNQLKKYQGKLNRLAWQAHKAKRSTVLVFEGADAGGKGGAIRRMTQAMDARLYRVISTAAPTDEERAHHYLWRFWRHIPLAGNFTLYDRSWYGRVLVERVEGFAQEKEWKRAFLEINNFEEQLVEHGTLVLKFWLHISPEEQLARFKAREEIAHKQHKITEEDWRNRDRWHDYSLAVNDMVARTSTHFAPWTLVAGNDKKFARIQILKTVCKHLERTLKQEPEPA
jgi:polyphosphate:AMP phosphotransferase